MSIPPTKKRKLDGLSGGSKHVKTLPIKSALKKTVPSRTASSKSKPFTDSRISDDLDGKQDDEEEEYGDKASDAPDTSSLSDNDGDISDTSSPGSNASDDDDDDDEFIDSTLPNIHKRKRNDPTAFSTSMTKILSSHLTSAARKDPILIRSVSSSRKHQQKQLEDARLEAKAKRLLSLEKKKELDKYRIKDVIPKDDATGEEVKKVLEHEKMLRKVAQRGVIKLFNAVFASQMKGLEAERESKAKGVIGIEQRQQKVTEMSKQGFLELIQSGGKK